MKKCSRCGSINGDDESRCGVCGYSLTPTASGLGEPARVENPPVRVQSHFNKAGIAVLLLGAAVTVLGAIGLFLLGVLGLAILVPGLFLVLVGMNSAGRTTTGAMPLTGGFQPTGLGLDGVG